MVALTDTRRGPAANLVSEDSPSRFGGRSSFVGVSGLVSSTLLARLSVSRSRRARGMKRTVALTPTLHQLADLRPTTLALMHGASFTGDGAARLRGLATGYAELAAR